MNEQRVPLAEGGENRTEKRGLLAVSKEQKSLVFSFKNLSVKPESVVEGHAKLYETEYHKGKGTKDKLKRYQSDSGKKRFRRALRNIEFAEDELEKQQFNKKSRLTEPAKVELNDENVTNYEIREFLIRNQSTRENLKQTQDINFLSVPKQEKENPDSPLLSDASFDENNNVLNIGSNGQVYNSNMLSGLSSKIQSFKAHGNEFEMYQTFDSKQEHMLPFHNPEQESLRGMLGQSENLFEINEFEEEYENKAISIDSIRSMGLLNELETEEWDL